MDTATEHDIRITFIEGQIEIAKAYVAYWVGMATSGAATRRRIFKGGSSTPMTAEELTDEAMATALNHIRRIDELNNARDELLHGRDAY